MGRPSAPTRRTQSRRIRGGIGVDSNRGDGGVVEASGAVTEVGSGDSRLHHPGDGIGPITDAPAQSLAMAQA
jgi:hypothetical protein